MRWSVGLLFFCLACQNQPVAQTLDSDAKLAKVTRETPSSNSPTFDLRIMASPRRHQEVEGGILGHPDVRKCMDQAAQNTFESFDVMIFGRIAKSGELGEVKLERASKGFELCMIPALKVLNLGNGRSGLLKMQVYRKQGQNQIKKFE